MGEMDQVMGYEAGQMIILQSRLMSFGTSFENRKAYFRRRQEKMEAGKMISGDIVFIAGEMKVLIKMVVKISLTKRS